MAEITFVATNAPLKGKRAAVVAHMVAMLVEAEGDIVTWDELSDGVEHPHQYTPALMSLELVGAIKRWEYSEVDSRGKKTAYSLTDKVTVESAVIEDTE
jgi:hypothetical protein